MKKSTILISVLLAVLMLISAAACAAPKQQSPETASGVASLPEVTIRMYLVGDKRQAADEVWEYISELTKDRLNAKFEPNFSSWGDLPDKIKTAAASGDNFDLVYDADWQVYPLMVNNGAYMGLNELMPKYAPGLYKKYQDLGILNSAKVNGEIMAMPWVWKASRYPIFLWRGDIVEQAGMEQPEIKSLEDVDNFLYALKDVLDADLFPFYSYGSQTMAENLMTALAAKYQYNHPTYGSLHYLSFSWEDPTCKLIPIEQTEMYKEAAMYAKKWRDDDLVPRDMISNPNGNPFRNELSATIIAHWGLSLDSFVTSYTTTATKEHALFYPGSKYPLDSPLSNIMAMNKNAANPERAMMFMELVHTDQAVYDAVNYGIEGKTYVFDGDVVVFPEGLDVTTSNYMYWDGYGFWNRDMERATVTRPGSYWEVFNDFTAQPTNFVWPLAGFMATTDPIKDEITKREALRQELGRLIEFGMVDNVDVAIDEYIAKQKEAGVDKLMEVMQSQVDAFLKSLK